MYLNTAAEGIPPLAVGAALDQYFRDKQQGMDGRKAHAAQWDAAKALVAEFYGLTPSEINAWVYHGGGQALWDELSAGFGLKPLMCGNTGPQMGGWFTKELIGVESYKGLRYRMPGVGGEVLRRLGAVVVNLPASEIIPSLRSGAIDASEFAVPGWTWRSV